MAEARINYPPSPGGDYKQSEHGKVILPPTVLRRLGCVLDPTQAIALIRVRQAP